ncbi:MAG: deoxyribose-phosphate aldolase [Bacteroidetes bacterium]|nr:deoxyribose-phosphate aldolase [Bacteroidota bacterium]
MMNHYIDHTLLKADATHSQIENLCKEAKLYNFASVCIHPHYVQTASQLLADCPVKVCTVVGFPLGSNTTKTKVFETQNALKNGADEIDMVINVSWLKDKAYDQIQNEITSLKSTVGKRVLKVIVEISLLTKEELAKISQIVSKSGADFIKTSTGFSAHGATLEAVKMMKENISENVQIKASGGIRDYKTAKAYIDLGVARLGTSSGVEIVEGRISNKTY